METGRLLCHARPWLLAAAAALAACGPRPAPPPEPEAQPPVATAPAPAIPAPRPAAPPEATAPGALPPSDAPGGARGGPRIDRPLADAERGPVLFTHWRAGKGRAVENFEAFLVRERVAHVVPTYQLLRSASMWKECRAEPFQLPPPQTWNRVRELLFLLGELRRRGVLPDFEVVSAYRDPRLNRCAGGAPGSAHQVFAVDIAPLSEAEARRLCRFWREHGRDWDMGVSRYPSGRIHIDRNGYRTWGASYGRGSSYCLG